MDVPFVPGLTDSDSHPTPFYPFTGYCLVKKNMLTVALETFLHGSEAPESIDTVRISTFFSI
jgi:hypothetical protein